MVASCEGMDRDGLVGLIKTLSMQVVVLREQRNHFRREYSRRAQQVQGQQEQLRDLEDTLAGSANQYAVKSKKTRKP